MAERKPKTPDSHDQELEEETLDYEKSILHATMLVELKRAFDIKELGVLKSATKAYLPNEHVPESFDDILDCLDRKQLLYIGQYDVLKRILDIADLQRLMTIVEKCERHIKSIDHFPREENHQSENRKMTDKHSTQREETKIQNNITDKQQETSPKMDGMPLVENHSSDQNTAGSIIPNSSSTSPNTDCSKNKKTKLETLSGVFSAVGKYVQEGIRNFDFEHECNGHVYCKSCSKVCCLCCGAEQVIGCNTCAFWKTLSLKCDICDCPSKSHVGVQCEEGESCNGGEQGEGPTPRGKRN